jgi:hypothetical protein
MESEQGSSFAQKTEKKKDCLVGGVTSKAEARLPEGIKERVMMATTRGAEEAK